MKKKIIELAATSTHYFSENDENAFFEWLQKIPAVIDCKGTHLTLHISVDEALFDENAYLEFMALYRRYGLDLDQFAIKKYFYWYQKHSKKAYKKLWTGVT